MAWGVPKIGAVAEANGGNLTLAEPAGIAQGDLMVACFAIRSTVGFTNSDWVKIESQLTGNTISTGAGIASAELWICVRGASAPTLLFSRTGGDVARGLIIAYAGGKANVTAIQSNHSSNTLASASATATTGTISTVEANELIVAMIGHGDNYTTSAFDAATDPTTASGATDTTTAPTAGTWIERSDSGTNTGADTALGVADAIRGTAGATGTIQCTSSGSARHAMIAAAFRLLVDTTVAVGLGAVTIAGFSPTVTATSNVTVATGLGAVTIAGFVPTVTVSVQNTNVATGLGAVTIAGFAPSVAVAPALNYAISFSASAYSRLGDEGSPITDLKNATALGITMRIRGDRLKNASGAQPLVQLSGGYLGLRTNGGGGNVAFDLLGFGLGPGSTTGVTQASIDDTAYYTLRAWRDNSASPKFALEIFKPDTTSLDGVSSSPADVTISNGTYGDFSVNYDSGSGASADALVCDWCAAWDRIPPGAGSAPSQPAGSETGLLHWHKWNENGGTIGDDQQSATNAALTGTYAWILISTGTTATPAVGAVTVAGFAPQVNLGIVPGLGAVTIAGFAPSAIADTKITTGLGAVTVAGFAPSAVIGTVVSTGLGAVTVSGLAPTTLINLTIPTALGQVTVAGLAPAAVADTKVTTDLGVATISGFAPSAIADTKITTGLGALTLTGFAPTVQLPVTVTTGLGEVTIVGFATTLGLTIYGETGSVTLAGFSPTVVTPNTVTTDVGAVTVAGFAPAVQLPVLVTTDMGSVTTAGFAPSIIVGFNVFPDAGSVTLAGFSPTVSASDHQTVSTQLGQVTVAGFAPSLDLAVTPGTGQVTVAGLAPSVLLSDNQTAAAQTGAVTIDGFAPTLVLPVTVTTDVGAVVIAGFTPTISVTAGTILTDLGHVTITGFAPTVTATAHQTVTTGLGVVTIAGFAPQVNVAATPGTGLVSVTGFAPSVATTNNQAVTPGLGTVDVTGLAPTLTVAIRTGLGAVNVTGFAPTVLTPVTTVAGLGSVIEVGYRPTVTASNHQTVTTGLGAITVAGFAPSAAVDLSAQTQTGTVDVTGFAPTLVNPAGVTPGTGLVTVTGFAPTVTIPVVLIPVIAGPLYPLTPGLAFRDLTPGLLFREVQPALTMQAVVGEFATVEATGDNLPQVPDPTSVTPDVGVITVAGYGPTVNLSASATPDVGVITLTGFAPMVGAVVSAAPDVGTVDLEGFAPTAGFSASATPDVGAIDLVGRAPIVDVQGIDFILTVTGALSVAGFAPTVSATANVTVTPGVGGVTVSGLAPRAIVATRTGLGQVTVAGFAPSAIANRTVTPGAGAVTIAGFAPTVTGSAPVTVSPGVGVVTVTGFAPTFGESEHPNEPSGMTVLHTHDGTTVSPVGWWNATGDISIETDPEKGDVLQMTMSPVTTPGVATARIDTGLPEASTFGPTKVYLSFWERLSPNFKGNNGSGSLKNMMFHAQCTYFGGVAFHFPGLVNNQADVDSRIRPVASLPVWDEHDGIDVDPNDNILYLPADEGQANDPGELLPRDTWVFFEALWESNSNGNADGLLKIWVDGVLIEPTVYTELFINGLHGTGLKNVYNGTLRITGLEITNVWGGGGTAFACDNWYRFKDIYVSGGFARAGERPDHWVVTSLDGTTVVGGSDVRLVAQLVDENDNPVELHNPTPSVSVTNGGTWDYRAGTAPDFVELEHGRQQYTLHTTSGAGTHVFTVSDNSISNNFQDVGALRTGSITITKT